MEIITKNIKKYVNKGGLISGSFSLWLDPPRNVPKNYPKHLLFSRWKKIMIFVGTFFEIFEPK